METIFGTIKKNGSENVQVTSNIYKKSPVIDVRVRVGDKLSRKGLTMGLSGWKEILPIIAAAVEELEKQLADPDSVIVRAMARNPAMHPPLKTKGGHNGA